MKKHLLRKNSVYNGRLTKHAKRSNSGIFFAFAILVLLFWVMPRSSSVLVNTLFYPVHLFDKFFKESSHFFPTLLRDRKSLEQEIKKLNNKLAILETDNKNTKNKLLEENKRLKEILKITDKKRIVAGVIARPDELPFDFLQLDKGADSGIKVGAPVFVGQSTVIGLVSNVFADYSFVKLVSSPGFQATVFVSGPNVVAEMDGYGGGVSRVKVPQGVELKEGDLVYLPGVDTGVFGAIASVSGDVTQSEKYGFVTFDVPLSSLFWVTVGNNLPTNKSYENINMQVTDNINTILRLDSYPLGAVATTSSSTDNIKNTVETQSSTTSSSVTSGADVRNSAL